MKTIFFKVLIADSIKEGITNTSAWAGVRCSTKRHSTTFYHFYPISRQAHRWLLCFLVAFYSCMPGPVLAQMPEYEASRENDFREWESPGRENKNMERSSLDQDEHFQLEADARGILQDKLHAEMPMAAISSVKPVAHAGMNICKRTAAVLSAILSKISGTNDCGEVTSTQLAAITGLLRLDSKNISSLKAGDFDGLISLSSLDLRRNNLATLPDGIFDELTSLNSLVLSQNDLNKLPDGIFDELTSLTELDLSSNDLSMLPDGIYDELISLTELDLLFNDLSMLPDGIFDSLSSLDRLSLAENDLSALPDGIFDSLTSLTWLDLSANDLSTLRGGIFDSLRSLDGLDLSANDLSTLPDGIFDSLRSLDRLSLTGNDLSTLPNGIFDSLTSLTELWFGSNDPVTLPRDIFDSLTSLEVLGLIDATLSALPDGIFDELTSLTGLYLSQNDLSTLPEDIFDELTSLTSLDLSQNDLSTLPDGIFDKLTSLNWLELSQNDLSMLPDGIFDELTSLTALDLSQNDLSMLPGDIFDELTSLTRLRLHDNDLSTLPDGIFEDLSELQLGNRLGSIGLLLQGNPGAPFRPVVSAGANLTVQPGTVISIPGSVTGPWGFVRWTWIQVDGPRTNIPISGALRLAGGDTAMPSFTAPMTEGELYFRLVTAPAREGRPSKAYGHATSNPDWITIRVDVITSNEAEAPPVVDFDLLGNYPNPFNPSTTILLDLPETAAVSVDIFNMLGQRVQRENFPTVAAGSSQPLPLNISPLPSGTYVYQVTAQMGKEIHHARGHMTFIK